MTDFIEPIKTALMGFSWRDFVDILIVAFIIYYLIRILAKTRAIRIAIGLCVILLLARVLDLMHLTTITWLLTWLLQASAVLIVVLFQPELRRALERLGRGKVFTLKDESIPYGEKLVDEFSHAILNMAKHKTGAILVFERRTGLEDVLESGTMLDAQPSYELIENIFFPNSPLHDGAMVVRNGRIVAAGCFLPLSDNKQISSELGTRHRAALGVSEVSDAYVIVVSEERGTISFAFDGVLKRHVDAKELKGILTKVFISTNGKSPKRGDKLDLSADTKEMNLANIVDGDETSSEETEDKPK